jgi:hypothetical protein
MALLVLLCLDQSHKVSIRAKRPGQVSDVIANFTPQGHAPWLQRLLIMTTEDTAEGAKPLPWITPSFVPEGGTLLTWTSSRNSRYIRQNRNLAFRPTAPRNHL